MRIVIWGTGAIGGTLGAYLIRAGHDVLFVDIVEEHVAGDQSKSGLHITGPVDELPRWRPKALLPSQTNDRCNTSAILLCVKVPAYALSHRQRLRPSSLPMAASFPFRMG